MPGSPCLSQVRVAQGRGQGNSLEPNRYSGMAARRPGWPVTNRNLGQVPCLSLSLTFIIWQGIIDEMTSAALLTDLDLKRLRPVHCYLLVWAALVSHWFVSLAGLEWWGLGQWSWNLPCKLFPESLVTWSYSFWYPSHICSFISFPAFTYGLFSYFSFSTFSSVVFIIFLL